MTKATPPEAASSARPTDAAKELLQSYGALQRKIDNKHQRLRALVGTMGSPSTSSISGMPGGGGGNDSKVERLVLRKDNLAREIARLEQEERALLDRLEALIARLKNPDEQAVIEMHYIDGLRWWPICAALYSAEPDYELCADKYLKRAFKLHGSALQAIARMIEAPTP